MSTRDDFLARVRHAVAAGNRAGTAPDLPSRGRLGYQGAGGDSIECFRSKFTAAGGSAQIVDSDRAAVDTVHRLIHERGAPSVLVENSRLVERLQVKAMLEQRGLTVRTVEDLSPETARDAFFAADVGITNVRYLIAETGTVVMTCDPRDPRSASLLPPVHIAIAHRDQLLDDLFDFFEALDPGDLCSCVTLITGPSKTGDIELKLVTGVHGPGEVHVVLLE